MQYKIPPSINLMTEKIVPTIYQKYTFNIYPPIYYAPDDIIKEDVVMAHSEEEARAILRKSYGTKFVRDFDIVSVEEVTLFASNYTKCGDEDEFSNLDKEEEYDETIE